ncbi:hypothetical protein CHELA1G2_11206 [Hyphomicrobiales bacterium]|nr:hypothetical protein CHELA1G2_11206 [Hyphomicrobiales bacterium]
MPKPSGAPTRTAPASARSALASAACTSAISCSTRSATVRKCSPAGVSTQPRVLRSTSLVFSEASSAASRRLTVAWSSPSRRAAPSIWPDRATARKTRAWSQSNHLSPEGVTHAHPLTRLFEPTSPHPGEVTRALRCSPLNGWLASLSLRERGRVRGIPPYAKFCNLNAEYSPLLCMTGESKLPRTMDGRLSRHRRSAGQIQTNDREENLCA